MDRRSTTLPVLALAGALTLSGCAHAWFTPTGAATYPPRPDDCAIEVYTTGIPDREYEELGILEGESGWFDGTRMSDILPEMKVEACRAGGDALVIQMSQRYASGEDGDDKIYSSATVIRWIGPAPGSLSH